MGTAGTSGSRVDQCQTLAVSGRCLLSLQLVEQGALSIGQGASAMVVTYMAPWHMPWWSPWQPP